MKDEFIRKEAAEKLLENLCTHAGNEDMAFALNFARNGIKAISAADVRPVLDDSPYIQAAIDSVINERKRQIKIWGGQYDASAFEFMSILGEEFGELCEAVNETCFKNPKHPECGGKDNVYKEASHVAAVAVKFMEALLAGEKETAS